MSIMDVVQVLEKTIEIHCALLELGEEKKQVLIKNQVDRLTQIVRKETILFKQIDELERERVSSIGKFMQDKGYPPNPTIMVAELSKLVVKMEEKKALIDMQQQLIGAIERLKTINDLNQQLVQQSLAFIEYSLDLVVGPEDDSVYHNPSLQNQATKRNGYFDTKA